LQQRDNVSSDQSGGRVRIDPRVVIDGNIATKAPFCIQEAHRAEGAGIIVDPRVIGIDPPPHAVRDRVFCHHTASIYPHLSQRRLTEDLSLATVAAVQVHLKQLCVVSKIGDGAPFNIGIGLSK